MRIFKVWPLVAACAASLAAHAQQPENNAPPPPTMEKLEEGQPPEINIRKPEQQNSITEKRAPGGKVTETRVTSGKSTYYLKPNDQLGSTLPGDTQSTINRGAQWEVKEFDLGRKHVAEGEPEQATQVPAPPPVAPAQKK